MSILLQVLLKQAEQLSETEQLELIQGVAQMLQSPKLQPRKKHKLSEFCGIAPDLLEGQDAQEWVNELRGEWGDRFYTDSMHEL